MKRIQRQAFGLVIIMLFSSILMACGQKGPLRHPEPNSQATPERE